MQRARKAIKVTPDLLVLRGSPVLRDLLAKPDPRVNPGQEVSPVHRDLKGTGASQDLQAHRDRRESGDLRGHRV